MSILKPTERVPVAFPRYARWGELVDVIAILPDRIRMPDLPARGRANLRKAYTGGPEVTETDGRVCLRLSLKVNSDGIATQAQKFATAVTEHLGTYLGFIAEPAPSQH